MNDRPCCTPLLLLILLILAPWYRALPGEADEPFIDSLLSRMTLEEKVGQLVMLPGWKADSAQPGPPADVAAKIRAGRVGSFLYAHGVRRLEEAQRVAAESRLKIPLLFGYDVIHGFTTTFPIPLGEAAAFSPGLSERAARAAAAEASAAGLHWTFAPMVDIARDPRWGRIAEGSGEDPYLGSVLAVAKVRGFQGSSLASPEAIAACAKHFVAYGAAEGGRDYNTAEISERTLREVYLPPFHAAVEAGAASVMSSFNEIAGIPVSGSIGVLREILKTGWDWDGMVVSDWNSVGELINHGIAASRPDAARLGLRAGVDIDMCSGTYADHLDSLVRAGAVPHAELDDAVRRVLRLKLKLGLFSNPAARLDAARETRLAGEPAHRGLARELARKSFVLLKNNRGTLPFSKGLRSIAVIGPLADSPRDMLGTWAVRGDPTYAVTVLEGVRRALPGATVYFARGCPVDTVDRRGFEEALRLARQSEAVLLCIGESEYMSGEAASRASLDIPGVQQELAEQVLKLGKPTGVALFNGRPLTLGRLDSLAPAILECWAPGHEAGNAVADVLFGDYSPEGKLPVTFPRSVGQVPLYYNHKNTGRPPAAGEHWTSKYRDESWLPLYPFGYGLSYTTFGYTSLRLSADTLRGSDSITVSVGVRNDGKRAGTETVQLYVRDYVGSVTRPVKELKGFTKVTLGADESAVVSFVLRAADLRFWTLDLKFAAEEGRFAVMVGGDSRTTLSRDFTLVAPLSP